MTTLTKIGDNYRLTNSSTLLLSTKDAFRIVSYIKTHNPEVSGVECLPPYYLNMLQPA